ncbi:MAG: hypothetical protein ABIH11_08720 [Candidatus Altiarchaeota archaeon]
MPEGSSSSRKRSALCMGGDAYAYLIILIVFSPSLAWVCMHNGFWNDDAVYYGRTSLLLNHYFKTMPLSEWYASIFEFSRARAPLHVWVGQWFAQLGVMSGYSLKGMLAAVLLYSLLSLMLSYAVLKRFFGGGLVPLAGSVFMASAPMFIGLSTKFFTEPLQLLIILLFLYVFAFHTGWSRSYTLLCLLSLSSLALLVKTSTPLYVLVPSIIVLKHVLSQGLGGLPRELGVTVRKNIPLTLASIMLLSYTLSFYSKNLSSMRTHAGISLYSPVWVLQEPFTSRIHYVLSKSSGILSTTPTLVLTVLIIMAAFHSCRRRRCVGWEYLSASLLQLLIIISFFGYYGTTSTRFLFGILPYASVIVSWSLAAIGDKRITSMMVLAFILQSLVINAQTLGLIPFKSNTRDSFLTTYNHGSNVHDAHLELTNMICNNTRDETVFQVAGDWFPHSGLMFLQAADYYGLHCLSFLSWNGVDAGVVTTEMNMDYVLFFRNSPLTRPEKIEVINKSLDAVKFCDLVELADDSLAKNSFPRLMIRNCTGQDTMSPVKSAIKKQPPKH